jgi:hypothetical protein
MVRKCSELGTRNNGQAKGFNKIYDTIVGLLIIQQGWKKGLNELVESIG